MDTPNAFHCSPRKLKSLIDFISPNHEHTFHRHNAKKGIWLYCNTPSMLGKTYIRTTPHMLCTLTPKGQKITLDSLIDTGAKVTVISQAKWPSQWSLAEVLQALSGIAGSSCSCQSHHLIQIKGPEGHCASVILFVLPMPMVLWWGIFSPNGALEFNQIFNGGHWNLTL